MIEVLATANQDIYDGKRLVAKAGQKITVIPDGRGSVYVPVSTGGYIVKPAYFVTLIEAGKPARDVLK